MENNGHKVSFEALLTEVEWNDLKVKTPSIIAVINLSDRLSRLKKNRFSVLFYGVSGTGKTIAATLLAKQLNREIYRVNLSHIITKYIGETEKNLNRLFKKTTNKNWILFFDEADALFGKRTEVNDAHNRYANQEVSYLLRCIKSHPGIIFLSVNKKKIKNKTFKKRFDAVVKFKPGE